MTFTDAKGRVHTLLGIRGGRAYFRVAVPGATRLVRTLDPLMGGDSAEYTSSTDDGYLKNQHANYTACRTAAIATAVYNTANYLNIGQSHSAGSGLYDIHRAGLFFDSSGLPDNADITDAIVRLNGYADYSTTDFYITVVSLAGSRPMVEEDYDQLGTTSYGTWHTSNYTANDFDITLNAAGRAAVNLAGWTNLGLRSDRDINGNTPTEDTTEYVQANSANLSTGKPRLVLTYSIVILATCTLGFSAAIQATGLLDLLGAASLSFSAAISATPVLIHMGAATLSFSAGIDAASPLTVVIFAENPTWEKQMGAKPNRVRCRIAGGTTVKTATAGGVPAGEEVDYWCEVPAGTTEGEAQSTADAVLAAIQARPISVAGPIPLRVGIDFAETILTEWWERTGATATKREAVALVVAKKEHDITAGVTRISLGDYAPSTMELIAQILAKLSR